MYVIYPEQRKIANRQDKTLFINFLYNTTRRGTNDKSSQNEPSC